MYLVTVIIPIYNAEKFLKKTVNSIINQTIGFENIELILVDDNSSDSSKDIIIEYSNNYSNIKPFFLDKNHGFPGHGRNTGIENATADYIMFSDADDEYEPEYCETVYNVISNNQCDSVLVNYTIFDEYDIKKRNLFSSISSSEIENNGMKLISLDKFCKIFDSTIWSMIFKRSIISNHGIRFIEDGFNEDTLFLYEYYCHANNLMAIDYFGYKYYRHGNTLTDHSTRITFGFLNSYEKIYKFVNENYDGIDVNYLLNDRIETTLFRIIHSSNQKCLLKRLYEVEMKLNMNVSLNQFWATFCNRLLFKKQFLILIVILRCIKFATVIKFHITKFL